MKVLAVLLVVAAVVLLVVNAVYVVDETEQVVITQYGKPVGAPVTTPGIKFKIPLIQKANYLDKGILDWRSEERECFTRDEVFLRTATSVQWRVSDSLTFFKRLRGRARAETRLADIVDGETRHAIGQHDYFELVRTTNRNLPASAASERALTRLLLDRIRDRVKDLGIEIIDFRFERLEVTPLDALNLD